MTIHLRVLKPKTSLKVGVKGPCEPKPRGLALDYVKNKPHRFLVVYDAEAEGPWIFVYDGRKRVFDCNPQFFESWFDFPGGDPQFLGRLVNGGATA